MEFKVSIDKLVILGDECKEKFEYIINNNRYGFIEGSGLAKQPYDRNFYMVDGSVLQYSKMANMKALRYEFNPNKIVDDKEKLHTRSIVECISTMKYPKYSRVDIAIDLFDISLSDFKIHHEPVKTNVWYDRSGRLETLYIGAPNSDIRFRIYDKAKEREIDDKRSWWRVEVQLRDSFAMLPMIGENVFNRIKINKPILNNVEDIRVRSMLYYLEQFPVEWSNLNRSTKDRYKKILNTLPSEEDISIADLYQLEQCRIKNEMLDWLRIAERNNVI